MSDLAVYALARLIGLGIRFLPTRSAALGSRLLADLLWWLIPSRRLLAERNLKRALGADAERARVLAREVFREKAMTLFEFLSFPRITAENIDDYVEFEGLERLDRALDSGGAAGPILVTAHFGNWELLGAALALKGYPVNAVVKRQHNSYADRMINRYRREKGIRVIARGFGLREAYQRVRRGEALIILADQGAKRHGLPVEFFGRRAPTPVGPARFSQALGSPVLPVFMIREGYLAHRLVVDREVRLETGPTPSAAQETGTQAQGKRQGNRKGEEYVRWMTEAVNARLEDFVRRYPEQWNWVYRRWREKKSSGAGDDSVAKSD